MILNSFTKRILSRWYSEGGYREFLVIAFPLILSTGMWSIEQFIDRMFLSWYSPATIAAAMPAGMLNFAFMSFFTGTVTYVGTFVAQYFGAGQNKKVGPSVWQGVYISLLGGIVLVIAGLFSEPIFNLIGHEPAVRQNEIVFFRILCFGSFPAIATSALSGFFSGLGKTWPIMWVNIIGTLVTVVLDYFLIFGNWIFPELGMAGAAIATVASGIATFVMYLALMARPSYSREFDTLRGWRPNLELFKRIIYFGLPSGLQFLVDIAGFTTFVLIMGSLGMINLAATNIAFNINTIAFMPMLGGGIAVSVLVGQYLGKNRVDLAEKSAYSAFHITFGYMSAIALLYIVVPGIFIAPFASKTDPEDFKNIKELVIVLLRFVAAYSLFDTMSIVFESAIKGAGDTHFVFKMIAFVSAFALVIPSFIAIKFFHGGLYAGWTKPEPALPILAESALRTSPTT